VDNKAAGEAAGIMQNFQESDLSTAACPPREFVASLSPPERERLGGFRQSMATGHEFGTYCTIRGMDSDQAGTDPLGRSFVVYIALLNRAGRRLLGRGFR